MVSESPGRAGRGVTGVTVELRRNEDGTLDEALLYVDGACVFHLEQLNESEWYLGLHHGEWRYFVPQGNITGWDRYEDTCQLTLGAKRAKVSATVVTER